MFKHAIAASAMLALFAFVGVALAGASAQATAGASIDSRVIAVKGKPFFPVMLIDQCGAAAHHARALGANVVLNESCTNVAPRRQLASLSRGSLGILSIASQAVRSGRLLGWTYPDEPDNNGWTPARLRRTHPYPRGNADGLVTFLTTTGGFFRAPYRHTNVKLSTYAAFTRIADVAGFDLYPLNSCQSDLSAVYDAQRQFIQLAGEMPTFQWIETGPIRPSYCGGFTMTPAELRAEVWLAVAGGARGIGFFTHTWSPAHQAFDVTPAIRQTMKRTSDLLGAVAPGLLGKTVISNADSGAIKLLARKGNGRTYVFAVNAQRVPIHVQMYVPRLHDGSLRVFREKRSLAVGDHSFVDTFAPLAVHVYVQRN